MVHRAPGLSAWHNLSLTFDGSSITAAIDGTTGGSVTDSTYSSGMIGRGTSGYQTDQFDNVRGRGVGFCPVRGWGGVRLADPRGAV